MKSIKNIRLKDYNYKTDGYYFVTICANYRKPYFEDIEIKNIVVAELARLNELKGVKIDYSVLMPNHIHLIIILSDSEYSLFEIVKRFKSKTTIFVKKLANQGWQLQKLWQPNYYEHVIRNESALAKIREYIQNNPEKELTNFNQFYEKM
ncbi:MAG: transposase [Elusimicrobia bacterium]|nr:transposase [Elusimicrobiota bacterium]